MFALAKTPPKVEKNSEGKYPGKYHYAKHLPNFCCSNKGRGACPLVPTCSTSSIYLLVRGPSPSPSLPPSPGSVSQLRVLVPCAVCAGKLCAPFLSSAIYSGMVAPFHTFPTTVFKGDKKHNCTDVKPKRNKCLND